MNIVIQLILLVLLTQSCQAQDFNVKYENIEINIQGKPGPWLKHNDKFYCYFETDNDEYSSGSTKHFYTLDKNGRTESKIIVPENLQRTYYDLYLKNDTIFTTDYNEQNTFYLDKEKWIETKKGIDLFYEDNNYDVYSLHFGEWGSVTWFKDKKTNKQYEFTSMSPIINKLDDVYFITSSNTIQQITNPKKMKLSKEPYDYNKAVLTENYFRDGSHSKQGTEIIYQYKNDDDDDDNYHNDFCFATSFIKNNKLCHIYKDSISTKIGIIDNKKLTSIYDFKTDIIPLNYYYDCRYPIQKNGYQTIQFSTKKENEYGILEINENNILVTTFKNSYEEPILGTNFAKEQFEKQFQLYYSQLKNLKLEKAESLEKELHATDFTQRHMMSTSYSAKKLETPRIYRKIEDSTFVVRTLYYYTKNDNAVHVVNFEWRRNNSNKKISFNIDFETEEKINKRDAELFKLKLASIKEYLQKTLGKPLEDKIGPNSTETLWVDNEKNVELRSYQFSIDLTLYKTQ